MSVKPEDEPRRRDATTALRELAWTIHRRVPESATDQLLTSTELALLKHVLDTPDITVGELARRLGLHQSNTSAAVRSLVERGFVSREADPHDRRASHLTPTAAARSEDKAIAAAWSGMVASAMTHLEPEDALLIESAAGALERLNDIMRSGQSDRSTGAVRR